MMRANVMVAAAALGVYVSAAFGGFDMALQTLVIFMGIDYISGLLVAGVFKRSPKSGGGTLSSKCSWKGLVKKGMQLLIVLIAHRLDLVTGTDFVRAAVIFAFIGNELLSITENAGLMGVPIPGKLRKAIDALSPGV